LSFREVNLFREATDGGTDFSTCVPVFVGVLKLFTLLLKVLFELSTLFVSKEVDGFPAFGMEVSDLKHCRSRLVGEEGSVGGNRRSITSSSTKEKGQGKLTTMSPTETFGNQSVNSFC